jgi:hypothetical protein
MKIDRRKFLGMSLLAGASLTWGMRLFSQKKYNVLFIICDDLNDTVNGMGGHPPGTDSGDRLFEGTGCAVYKRAL